MCNIIRAFLLPGFIVLVCSLSTISFVGCNNIPRNNSHREISNSDIREGKELAATYCQSCHALPNPNMLDAKTWENSVLPAMGPRLGIFQWNKMNYPSSRYDVTLERNYYPNEPV